VDDSGQRSDDRASKRGEGAFLGRSAADFQENVTKSASVAGASYALVGAIILLGGIGYALDRWRGTSPWFLLGGLLVGIIVGFYELAKTVWPAKR
jgi:F0F1-type ATP synthase assembly protein I